MDRHAGKYESLSSTFNAGEQQQLKRSQGGNFGGCTVRGQVTRCGGEEGRTGRGEPWLTLLPCLSGEPSSQSIELFYILSSSPAVQSPQRTGCREGEVRQGETREITISFTLSLWINERRILWIRGAIWRSRALAYSSILIGHVNYPLVLFLFSLSFSALCCGGQYSSFLFCGWSPTAAGDDI